jgi:hypothetical protein
MLRTAFARLFGLAFLFMVVLGGMVVSTPAASAAGTPFNCSTVVTNGGFEDPQVAFATPNGATGWGGAYILINSFRAHTGTQLVGGTTGTAVTQFLNTSGLLAGDTLIVGFWNDNAVTASLGTSSTTTPYSTDFNYQFSSVSYTLLTDAEPLTLTIARASGQPYIDDVAARCTSAEPVVAADQTIDVPYEGNFDGTLTTTGGHDAFTYAVGSTAPTKGSVTVNPDGAFTYTANDGQSGTDSFTFTSTDPGIPELTATGTVTVTIAAPNTLTALPLAFSIDAGATGGGPLSALVSGGDPPYAFVVDTTPSQGTVTITPDGILTYTANPNASGSDSFTYTVSDDQATPASTTGTVTFTITAADAVVADDQAIDVPYEGATGYSLTATGGFGSYTFAEGIAPTRGTVAIEPDGSFLYTANPGQSGSDSFTFTATDTVVPALIGTGTVTVTIATPGALQTAPLSLTVDAGETVSGNLIDQVSGGDPPYGFTNLTGPGEGALTFDSFGPFSFTADPDASGTVTFTYSVSDDQATPATTTGTVTVTITAADAVVADNQSIDVVYEGSTDGTLTASGGFGAYTFAEADGPGKGGVTVAPDGSFTYTADPGQSGSDSFTFTATDTVLPALTSTGTVTVTIAAPDPLSTLPLAITVDAGETVTGNLGDQVTGGDSPYTFALDANPGPGTVTVDADGSFSYTADLDGGGGDSFTYTVSDDQATSATATGTVTITIVAKSVPATTVRVTADPRFPITGSAAIPGEAGLIYSLKTAPSIGSVVVNADGSFIYTVPSTMAAGDSFTVLATAADGETAVVTVIITFEIDPTVSTKGTVKPGGTGTGDGTPNDARDGVPSQPQPTSEPSDDSDDDDGRVERP